MPTLPVRAPADRHELLALVEPHDPDAIALSSAAADPALADRSRAWIVGAPGAEVGVAVALELAPARWSASVLCLDPVAAPTLARLLVASPARRLSGTARHVDPVAAAWPGHPTTRLPFRVAAFDEVTRHATLDPRARVATVDDVAAVHALYRESDQEVLGGPLLVQAIQWFVDRGLVVVAEVDATIVGAIRCEVRSPHFDCWSGLWVRPEHRGAGLGQAMHRQAARISVAAGRGTVGAVLPTNQMRSRLRDLDDEWVETGVPPAPPSFRSRALRKARRTVRRVRGTGQ